MYAVLQYCSTADQHPPLYQSAVRNSRLRHAAKRWMHVVRETKTYFIADSRRSDTDRKTQHLQTIVLTVTDGCVDDRAGHLSHAGVSHLRISNTCVNRLKQRAECMSSQFLANSLTRSCLDAELRRRRVCEKDPLAQQQSPPAAPCGKNEGKNNRKRCERLLLGSYHWSSVAQSGDYARRTWFNCTEKNNKTELQKQSKLSSR